MNPKLEEYYLSKPEPHKSTLLAMRDIVLSKDSKIVESLKYGLPFFNYRGNMFCYFSIEKKINQPYICMCEGLKLDHPLLDQKDRKRMKSLSIDVNEDIPIAVLDSILNDALKLYAEGIIKTKW